MPLSIEESREFQELRDRITELEYAAGLKQRPEPPKPPPPPSPEKQALLDAGLSPEQADKVLALRQSGVQV